MAFIESTYNIALTSGGGTVNLSVNDPYSDYDITGTVTLAASYVIQASGTPVKNTKFVFNYEANITLNGNTLTIFGLSLDASQALQSCFIVSKYDGSVWDTQIQPDFENSNVIETRHIINDAVDKDKIAADIAGNGLGQNANGSLEVKVDSSTIEIDTDTLRVKDDGVTNAKLANMADQTIKGNISGGSANPTDISIPTFINTNCWGLDGNSIATSDKFVGTTNSTDLVFKVNSIECGRPVDLVLGNVTYATYLQSVTTGYQNLAVGSESLSNVTDGFENTAIGLSALLELTTGSSNTAVGRQTLENVTTGTRNTAIGRSSGFRVVDGSYNTLIGHSADVALGDGNATKRIALGHGATADDDYQFAIPDDVTTIKFKGIVYTLPTTNAAGVLTNDGSGVLTWV